ncbi:MAG: septum formation initiator family protein [Candidatus Pacebacteria bacterium]|nr:septum formation initiator family protein [Candidatus Paceibacterota bacterium]MDD2757208.1 septum formation initiator family protein [Candidatus Paceibacterota bacterium]MDD3283853.1 septum formation initiator family protein [Candidatus Paceibacterota bacterium]MDD3970035.1 septum formation initiator family protein [Candidatus Paceibacterota bacterium]MDD4737803.1 septum formation initiator family protein [Candidatus Paceibacterota bacterium]
MVAKKRKKFNFKKVKTIFYFLTISFFVIVLLISCFNIYKKRVTAEKELNILNQEIDGLNREKDLLNFTLGETHSDEFLEKIAREELGMQKPGETIYIIKKELSEKEQIKEENYSFFERIMNWLKSLPE